MDINESIFLEKFEKYKFVNYSLIYLILYTKKGLRFQNEKLTQLLMLLKVNNSKTKIM